MLAAHRLTGLVCTACLLALMVSLCGCATANNRAAANLDDSAWPPDDPRVRLLETVKLEHSRGGGLARFLTGKRRETLLERPYGVAWRGQDLLVTDPTARQVVRINPRRRSSQSAPGLFASPIGVASCSDGILVSDSVLGKVALLDDDLELIRWVAEGLERPTGLDCHAGTYFIVETALHRILALEPKDRRPGQDHAPAKQAEGRSGFRAPYVKETVQVLDPARILRVLGRRGDLPGAFNYPTVVRVADESLWVGDSLNFRVQQFELDTGEPVSEFGELGDAPGEMPRLKGLALDAQGSLWGTDAHLDQVALYRQDGTFLMALGGTGTEAGRFSFPAGIAAHPDGRVAVVDSLNRRIQVFALTRPGARQ